MELALLTALVALVGTLAAAIVGLRGIREQVAAARRALIYEAQAA